MMISKRKMILGLAAALAGSLWAGSSANADFISDGNSQVVINPASQSGLSSWTIGSVDSLNQQWLWYRVGSTGPEQSIDTLNLVGTIGGSGADFLTVLYNDSPTAPTFELEITWTLTSISANQADLLTNISLNNVSESSLEIHLFQYSDFDLLATASNDNIVITGGNTATQTEGALTVEETVTTPTPAIHVAAPFGSLLTSLTDGVATAFVNDAGPYNNIDATWLFGWSAVLPEAGSLIIVKDQNLIIPEPASIALLGTGLLLIASRKRRQV